MKSKAKKNQKTFEIQYKNIMKDFKKDYSPLSQTPQWTNPSDTIVKFSMYEESSNSITSTDTLPNIEV